MSKASGASQETTSESNDATLTSNWVYDRGLALAAFALISIGLVMVYSSSSVYAARLYGDSEYFISRQLIWCCLGGVAFWFGSFCPRETLRRKAGWIIIATVILCALVLIPGIGIKVGGARRWLNLGVARFQPSELAKLAVIVLMASLLARRDRLQTKNFSSLLIPVAIAQIPVALILVEPDLGTALVIELILMAMIFVAGLRVRTILLFGLAALPVFYHFVISTPFRLRRILGYIDPWAYRSSIGYQITEALIAIGSGGIGGVGLGEGKKRLFFLPEGHTDFIFAILAEELGFVGVCILLSLFCIVVWRGVSIALGAADSFDAYLAMGLTALIAVPALFNCAVATGLLPTKGLPLPLISSGGSNLVTTLLALGFLMRIYRDGKSLQPEAEQT